MRLPLKMVIESLRIRHGPNYPLGYSIKATFCMEESAVSGCHGWPEFSSSIFNALFNQIQEVHNNKGVAYPEVLWA